MKIKSFEFAYIKAFKSLKFDLEKTSVLIGQNDHGKSSILKAKALTKGGFAADEATQMAQNQSKTGIAVTSICCGKGEGKAAEYST